MTNLRKLNNSAIVISTWAFIAVFAVSSAQAVLSFNIDKTQEANYGNLDQDDINPGGQFMCGPTAAVNSFVYLQNRYPGLYNSSLIGDADNDGDKDDYQDLIQAAQDVAAAGYMNTKQGGGAGSTGTYDDMFIYGKYQYMEDQLPGVSTYAAQLTSTWQWGKDVTRLAGDYPPIAKPAWVSQNTSPTWQFITSELQSCADLEILVNWTEVPEGSKGHFMTVTGFHWIDANNNLAVDQAEGATIDYIDPQTGAWTTNIPIWQLGPGGILDVGLTPQIQAQVTMAMSQIPEPATLGLLALGCLILLRRRPH
ncbi:MAG: PEP-CTERM sorting domain-containing protein [Planctomycetota bacterium]